YVRARHYLPSEGRFLSPDVATAGQRPGTFQYVSNDPANRIDPSGNVEINKPGLLKVLPCGGFVWVVDLRLGRNQRKGFIIQHVERYFVVYDCDELSFLVGSESCPVCETEGPPAELCAYWELWPVVDGIVYSARVPPKGRRPKPPEYDDSF